MFDLRPRLLASLGLSVFPVWPSLVVPGLLYTFMRLPHVKRCGRPDRFGTKLFEHREVHDVTMTYVTTALLSDPTLTH